MFFDDPTLDLLLLSYYSGINVEKFLSADIHNASLPQREQRV